MLAILYSSHFFHPFVNVFAQIFGCYVYLMLHTKEDKYIKLPPEKSACVTTFIEILN